MTVSTSAEESTITVSELEASTASNEMEPRYQLTEPIADFVSDNLSVISADVVDLHLPISRDSFSYPQRGALGRSRSRRWFELHYSGGNSEE